MGRTVPSYRLHQKDKEESGKYSGKDWTGRIEDH